LFSNPLIIFLAIGAAIGWLFGAAIKRSAFGLLGDLLVGILGALMGGWPFVDMEMIPGGGLVAPIVGATVGAVILLSLIRLVRRAAR
jgi:uncharacterized membrane protein YeaQ/YmgE (transglycosylase-associated protein family)